MRRLLQARDVKYERVPVPRGASALRPNWIAIVGIATLHAGALLSLLPWLFDWRSVVVMAFAVPLLGLGINMCYHRQLAHRSFRTPLWLEHAFVGLALCSLQETPAKWVANHRMHHVKADRSEDPHTPHVSLFWAHCGWLFFLNDDASPLGSYQRFARDILDDPWYMRLERSNFAVWFYLAHALAFFAAGAVVGGLSAYNLAEAFRLGLSFLVWGVLVRNVLTWHVTWSINSICHRFGYQSFRTGDSSRNHFVFGILGAGEGWHNNHHADPACATTQYRWWEIDTIFYLIKALERLGLARDVVGRKRGDSSVRA